MLIEITTFTLVPGADRDAFLDADQRVQHRLNPSPGILRRTTAESDDQWVVVTLWGDAESADGAEARLAGTDELIAFNSLIGDPETRRYRTLG